MRLEGGPLEAADVGAGDGQEVGQQLLTEQKRQQSQVEQLGVGRPVVVLLELDARILQVDDLRPPAASETFCASSPTEKDSVNWLNTRNSPALAGVRMANSTQASVSRMSRNPRCPPFP